MSWVKNITWDRLIRAHQALAVIVGDSCRDALRSLLRDDYERFCVETLEEALDSCRKQAVIYDRLHDEFLEQATEK